LAAKHRITSIVHARIAVVAVQRRARDAAQGRVAVLRTVAHVTVVSAVQRRAGDAAQEWVAVLRSIAEGAVVSAVQRRTRDAAQGRVAVLRTVAEVAVVRAVQRRAGNAKASNRVAGLRTIAEVAVVIADFRGITAAENRIAQVVCTWIAIIATCDGDRDAVITAHRIVSTRLRRARKKELKVDGASGDIGCGQCIRELFLALHRSLRYGFAAQGMLPYHLEDPWTLVVRSFGISLKPRWIVGAESLDQW
jgi:hypothetical protein